MILTFIHKGLEEFFLTGSKKGIIPSHHKKLRLQLSALDTASQITDMNIPGWDLHELQGDRRGVWSIKVNGNWRVTFKFVDGNVEVVNYEDYH
jgi:toxin HigB-1